MVVLRVGLGDMEEGGALSLHRRRRRLVRERRDGRRGRVGGSGGVERGRDGEALRALLRESSHVSFCDVPAPQNPQTTCKGGSTRFKDEDEDRRLAFRTPWFGAARVPWVLLLLSLSGEAGSAVPGARCRRSKRSASDGPGGDAMAQRRV